MKYLLMIHEDERMWHGLGEAERRQILTEYGQFTQQIKSTGEYVSGAQLYPSTSATSVRIREGKRLDTDGPFAETREQLGGFYLIDARDLDAALGIAARIPSARVGVIEVRPVRDMSPGAGSATPAASSAASPSTKRATEDKYVLLIYHDEQVWEGLSDEQRQSVLAEFGQFRQRLLSDGQFVDGAPLQPTTSATSVRVREAKRLVTDGPFAETREQLGGYFLIHAASRDEALAAAAGVPVARWGTIEVRQLVHMPAPVPATA